MVSKANRLKMESEKTFVLTQKAKEFKVPPKTKAKPKEQNIFAEFKNGPLSAGGSSTAASSTNGPIY